MLSTAAKAFRVVMCVLHPETIAILQSWMSACSPASGRNNRSREEKKRTNRVAASVPHGSWAYPEPDFVLLFDEALKGQLRLWV